MQKRQKFVWVRLFVLLIAACFFLPFVVLAMFIAWLGRMLSRLISFVMQKISGAFYSGFEASAIALGFMDRKDPEDSSAAELPVPDAGVEEDMRHADMLNAETLPQ